LGPLLGK